MNPGTNPSHHSPSASEQLEPEEYVSQTVRDRSVRIPVLFFFATATLWLVVASFFWLLSASQMYLPDAWWTLPGVSFLTYGRSYPIFLNSLVYGWASSAALGVGIWLVARLCPVVVRYVWLLTSAAAFWNLGLLLGFLSLLAGYSTGRELLEFPPYIAFLLFLALVVVSVWVILTLWRGSPSPLSVTQWYLVAGFLCFPWAYATANLLLSGIAAASGVSQPAIHWWYIGSLIGLWFTPICLALAFYLIPRSVNRPLYSYKLALLGFWTLLLFAGWTGTSHLLGGPLPAWMITIGAVANVLILIPVIAVALNFHHTLSGKLGTMGWDLPLRFLVLGLMSYTFYAAEGALISTRTLGRVAEFTLITSGHIQLGLFGFISMVLFGAFYYILPSLLQRKWLFPGFIKIHFWFCIVGFGLWYAFVTIGGVLQGFGLLDAKIPYLALSDILSPFLLFQNVTALLVVIGNLGFAAAVALIYLVPTRLRKGEEGHEFVTERAAEVTFS